MVRSDVGLGCSHSIPFPVLSLAPATFPNILGPGGPCSGDLRWISKGAAEGGKWGKDAYLGKDFKDGPILKEMVRNDEGAYTRAELPLADRIKYENGELKFSKWLPPDSAASCRTWTVLITGSGGSVLRRRRV